MRCEQHGLAAGPGGQCVVCLREARGRAAQRARWLALGFFGFVIATSGGLLAARLLRAPLLAEPARREQPIAVVAALRAEPPARVEATAPPLPATDLAPEPPLEIPVSEPITAASAISPVLAPVASVERTARARVPSKRELMAALHATPVSMFSTNWCPHCERARRFFRTYGLSVVDHDVDADAQAAAELQRRSGGKAVPLIDVDGIALKGFDERATMQAVVASVERRLGVTGIELSVASVSN